MCISHHGCNVLVLLTNTFLLLAQFNNNQLAEWNDINELPQSGALNTVYFEHNPIATVRIPITGCLSIMIQSTLDITSPLKSGEV
jgi:hypothetical protein